MELKGGGVVTYMEHVLYSHFMNFKIFSRPNKTN